jgi:nitroreductase
MDLRLGKVIAMEAYETIMTRRSIRRFTPQAVGDDLLEKLLRAAMAAPSASNEQPWHFIILRNRETLLRITGFHPFAEMLKEAALAIVVCAEIALARGMWVQDCAAATENTLLAAHSMGLGAVWLGVYPVEERWLPLQGLLGLPEGVIPCTIIALGYPAEKKKPSNRYEIARVHFEKW